MSLADLDRLPVVPPVGALDRQLFMMRVAGLPIESVAGLRCPLTVQWAAEVRCREAAAETAGLALADTLHLVIAGLPLEAARSVLIDVRRSVFNGREPRRAAHAVAVLRGVAQDAATELQAWLAERERIAAVRERGPEILRLEIERTRAHLATLLTEDRLRLGLLLASPALDAQLTLRAGGPEAARVSSKRRRKVDRSVVGYLYRTACKTSPFSTFTGVALGGGSSGEEPDRRSATEWTSFPRLNVVVLQRLADLIVADPQRRQDLTVSLTQGYGLDEKRIHYVRRTTAAGVNEGTVAFDVVSEDLFFLRRSGVLDRMVRSFQARQSIRYRDLVRWLATELGNADPDCERYVAALLSLGLLAVPSLRIDVHADDPLRNFITALTTVGQPWSDRLTAKLEAAAATLSQYPAGGLDRRRVLLSELTATIRDAGLLLREDGWQAMPEILVYEDVRAGVADGEIDAAELERISAPPLRALEAVLPAFDSTLAQKLTLKGFFLARYGPGGRCDDVVKLVQEFHEDYFDEYLTATATRQPYDGDGRYVPEGNWLGLQDLTDLDAARGAMVTGMRALWKSRGDADEIQLDQSLLTDVARQLPPVPVALTAQAHFLQLASTPEGMLPIYNGSYGGLSFAFSRFTHCFPGAPGDSPLSERLRARHGSAQRAGVLFAEVTGGFASSNLNLHARLTDFEIVAPGEVSSLPADRRIDLADLTVEHDCGSDRLTLRSSRLDAEVVPLYFGYLFPAALPDIPRFLLLFSPMATPSLDCWAGVPATPDPTGVCVRPRLCIGAMVVSRRTWQTSADAVPDRNGQAADADYFLRWQRWRIEHGLPVRVFARIPAGGNGSGRGRRPKPQYVDFDSYLSIAALESMILQNPGPVHFQEMLPTEDQLHLTSDRGHHVAELVVQTTRLAVGGADASTSTAAQHFSERD